MVVQDDDRELRVPGTALPFVALGAGSITAGGVVAAVAGPTDFDKGSWLAAYLVLVGGVALVALGTGQAVLARHVPSRFTRTAELAGWVVSTAAVIAGTLVEAPALTLVGGLLLIGVLVLFLATLTEASSVNGRLIWLYRGVIVILLVSIPIGLMLAWQRRA